MLAYCYVGHFGKIVVKVEDTGRKTCTDITTFTLSVAWPVQGNNY